MNTRKQLLHYLFIHNYKYLKLNIYTPREKRLRVKETKSRRSLALALAHCSLLTAHSSLLTTHSSLLSASSLSPHRPSSRARQISDGITMQRYYQKRMIVHFSLKSKLPFPKFVQKPLSKAKACLREQVIEFLKPKETAVTGYELRLVNSNFPRRGVTRNP